MSSGSSIDWKTIEDNYDTRLDDANDVLKEECEKLIDLKRKTPTFFAMEVKKNLSLPTKLSEGTIAASVFGCEREFGDGDSSCNPICIHPNCSKSVWQMNSDGSATRCLHRVEGSTAHLYAPSSVREPIMHLLTHREVVEVMKELGVKWVEVYRMAFSTSRYEGRYRIDEEKVKRKKCETRTKKKIVKEGVEIGYIVAIIIFFITIIFFFAYLFGGERLLPLPSQIEHSHSPF